MDKSEVNMAFEILLEEVETVVNNLNEDGAQAFQRGDYDQARRLVEDATRLTEFREKVKGLQKEWQTSFAARAPVRRKKRRKAVGKLPRGLRTPEEAFRMPILQALVELNGTAPMNEVLDIVGKKLGNILNEYDHRPLPSDTKQIRWRNTAQWCRNTLVREGLLKSDSPRGIWEISQKGREVLEKLRGEF